MSHELICTDSTFSFPGYDLSTRAIGIDPVPSSDCSICNVSKTPTVGNAKPITSAPVYMIGLSSRWQSGQFLCDILFSGWRQRTDRNLSRAIIYRIFWGCKVSKHICIDAPVSRIHASAWLR